MPDPCFCALELLSTTRIPPTFRYFGYECTDDVVTAIDVIRTFPDPMTVAPALTPMPALNDACSCGADHCQPLAIVKPAQAVRKAGPQAPSSISPCDEQFNPNLDILGQWSARTGLFPGKLLRLVALGRREQCRRLKVLLVGNVYDAQCLGGCKDCVLNECDLEFTNGGRHVWIGNVPGKQLGPFQLP